MEVSNNKINFNSNNNRENNFHSIGKLTYNEKIEKEINSIPKKYQDYFKNALNKYCFDTEVYITHSTETNRKVIPQKKYLLNNIILYENFVNLYKDKRDKMSKDSTKFFKFYQFVNRRNKYQKEYLNDLIKFYIKRGYDIKNIQYKKTDNIFNKSILLDKTFGNFTNKGALKFLNNEQNRRNFYIDNQLLLIYKDLVQTLKEPNSDSRNNGKFIKFNQDNINEFIKDTQVNSNINNLEEKNIKKIKVKKEKNEIKEMIEDIKLLEKSISMIEDEKDLFELKKGNKFNLKKENDKNLNSKNKTLANKNFHDYLKNNRLAKFDTISRNNDDENNTTNKSDKNINTITTDYGNNSITNENKNNEKIKNIKFNKTYLKNTILNSNVNKSNKIMRSKYSFYDSDSKKNKYLLNNLNQTKIPKKQENDTDDSNKDHKRVKYIIPSKSRIFKQKSLYKEKIKENLGLNLPGIDSIKNKEKSLSTNKFKNTYNNSNIKKENNNFKDIKEIANNKVKFNLEAYKDKKINNFNESNFILRKKEELERIKEKEINNLYSTINSSSKIFSGYPFDKVEDYFYKYKNIKIPKFNTKNGSNIHSLLDNFENAVKDKNIHKLAKESYLEKKILFLKNSKTLDNMYKSKDIDYEKIRELDTNIIPSLKYNYAENILCNNKNLVEEE